MEPMGKVSFIFRVCEMFLRCRFCLVGIILLPKIDLSLSSKWTFLQSGLYEERSGHCCFKPHKYLGLVEY